MTLDSKTQSEISFYSTRDALADRYTSDNSAGEHDKLVYSPWPGTSSDSAGRGVVEVNVMLVGVLPIEEFSVLTGTCILPPELEHTTGFMTDGSL